MLDDADREFCAVCGISPDEALSTPGCGWTGDRLCTPCSGVRDVPARPDISEAPFDGAVAWATLDAETQARIGAAALELGVAQRLMVCSGPASRAGHEAAIMASDVLQAAALDVRGWYECGETGQMFRVPSIVGEVCRTCGCSYHDPCEDGCGWAAPGLCTACADTGEAA